MDASGDSGADAALDAAPDAAPDAAVDAAGDATPDAAGDAVTDAAIDAVPDAAGSPTLDIVMTGSGDVAVFQSNAVVATCAATCTVTVDPAQPITVLASTLGTFRGFDGVAGPAHVAGGSETLAAGTASVAVAFDALAGELWYDATGAAFDAQGNLAISAGATTTVYDATYAPRWTVASGDTPAFDDAGDLYTMQYTEEDITPFKTEIAFAAYDPSGALLSSNTIVQLSQMIVGTVLPTGGVAVPDATTLTLYSDAGVTPAATAALAGGNFPYCLGVDGLTVHLAKGQGGVFEDGARYAYALDGTALGDDGGDWDWCAWGHNSAAGGAFVGYSETQGWVAYTRNARVVNDDSWDPPENHVFDWGDTWPFNAAAVDAAGDLYFQESRPPGADNWGVEPEDAHGIRVRAYADNSGVSVATLQRDAYYSLEEGTASAFDYFHVGVSVEDIAVAPDGRVALTVLYVAAGADTATSHVIVLPPL